MKAGACRAEAQAEGEGEGDEEEEDGEVEGEAALPPAPVPVEGSWERGRGPRLTAAGFDTSFGPLARDCPPGEHGGAGRWLLMRDIACAAHRARKGEAALPTRQFERSFHDAFLEHARRRKVQSAYG